MRTLTLAVFAALYPALGACGTSATPTRTTPARTSNPARAPSAPAPSAASTAPNVSAPAGSPAERAQQGATVPNLVGAALADAETDLKRLGISFRVLPGAGVGEGPRAGWTVCQTNPLPRTHLEAGTTLRLSVGRSCR